MVGYSYIAIFVILSQLLILFQAFRNCRYVLSKYRKQRLGQTVRVAIIVPCKGLDSHFEKNITSLFKQDYDNYILCFVVEDKSDPAYPELCSLKDRFAEDSRALDIKILVSGQAESSSQKIHNLLHAYNNVADDVEILAFADSDICVRPDWLSHLIWPLRGYRYGAATGYRWFVPEKNNLATLAMSALNARVAQQLGNTRFNQAWGGSTAIRVDVFRKVGLDKLWPRVLSDDLSLTYAVKKAGMKLAFVPACLVASYESTTWPKLFEFARRQFLITRVYRFWTWLFGLAVTLYSVLCIYATAALAIYAAYASLANLPLFFAVPIATLLCHVAGAVIRQRMIAELLEKDRPNMRFAAAADILLTWLWSLLLFVMMLSSAIGRTISWRGIKYKLISPTETIIKTGG
ncbi:MAG: glycosyltransferase family 2 protein [Sedimentisphaerales bacterium]|nr:glycosyltransferase family 2 protein [Sedimentisphaerales bacterium]